jgi:hypothetical protein
MLLPDFLRPLLAEVVLSLQKLTIPRPTATPVSAAGATPALTRKATSVVVLNAPYYAGQGGSGTCLSQSPFSSLLADPVDYSVRLRRAAVPDIQHTPRLGRASSSLRYYAGNSSSSKS